jgi:hypothetical protein
MIKRPTKFFGEEGQEKPELHKQSRGLLKTAGVMVGRSKREKNMFKNPMFDGVINPRRETMPKTTAIVGLLLYKLWQENKDEMGIYTIKNLGEVAGLLGITTQNLKIHLVYLGGYALKSPIVYEVFKDEKGRKGFAVDRLFYVKFFMRFKDGEKEEDFTEEWRVGTDWCNFIKDREVLCVQIEPSMTLKKELAGDKFGYVYVDDGIISFSLGLSDLAFKIFCFSASNRPNFKIRFNKLINKKYLNLEEQVKKEGKPAMLKEIQEALTELKDKGHIKEWSYDPIKDMFSWSYTDAVVKHQDFFVLPPPDTPKEGENT